jgi:hypothetical protein
MQLPGEDVAPGAECQWSVGRTSGGHRLGAAGEGCLNKRARAERTETSMDSTAEGQ